MADLDRLRSDLRDAADLLAELQLRAAVCRSEAVAALCADPPLFAAESRAGAEMHAALMAADAASRKYAAAYVALARALTEEA